MNEEGEGGVTGVWRRGRGTYWCMQKRKGRDWCKEKGNMRGNPLPLCIGLLDSYS